MGTSVWTLLVYHPQKRMWKRDLNHDRHPSIRLLLRLSSAGPTAGRGKEPAINPWQVLKSFVLIELSWPNFLYILSGVPEKRGRSQDKKVLSSDAARWRGRGPSAGLHPSQIRSESKGSPLRGQSVCLVGERWRRRDDDVPPLVLPTGAHGWRSKAYGSTGWGVCLSAPRCLLRRLHRRQVLRSHLQWILQVYIQDQSTTFFFLRLEQPRWMYMPGYRCFPGIFPLGILHTLAQLQNLSWRFVQSV